MTTAFVGAHVFFAVSAFETGKAVTTRSRVLLLQHQSDTVDSLGNLNQVFGVVSAPTVMAAFVRADGNVTELPFEVVIAGTLPVQTLAVAAAVVTALDIMTGWPSEGVGAHTVTFTVTVVHALAVL
jgi:hypothetical protein